MPRIEELPIPAQNEIRAKRGELSEDHPEKRRKTLLQRLASVGLGRRDEEREAPAEIRPMMRPAPMPERMPERAPERMPPPVQPPGLPSRCPSSPSGQRLRASTCMDGKRLCIIRLKTINLISRLSCAGRPTNRSRKR